MAMVSVIMAAYNSDKYISEAIESIINQTFQDWELIICDDFSDDLTYEIATKYSLIDKRVRVIKNSQNQKAAFSRNRCIQEAKGNYIAIQDADDISVPARLEEELQFLKKNLEIDFVGSAADTFNEKKEKLNTLYNPLYPKKKDFLVSFPFVHASIMFKKNALLLVDGYRVSSETVRGQDADMIMRMYAKELKGANLQSTLYLYRRDENAEKRRSFKKRFRAVGVRYKRFKELELLPMALPYIFVPLIGSFFSPEFKLKLKRLKYGGE